VFCKVLIEPDDGGEKPFSGEIIDWMPAEYSPNDIPWYLVRSTRGHFVFWYRRIPLEFKKGEFAFAYGYWIDIEKQNWTKTQYNSEPIGRISITVVKSGDGKPSNYPFPPGSGE
jgi:hypothetical protein